MVGKEIYWKDAFQRTELLVGEEVMNRIINTRVIIFGIGGVGSWCAESLARSGISHITLVDSDLVCESNINRQSMATVKTIGKAKVEVLKDRLLEINPSAEIEALQKVYNAESSSSFHLNNYDFIIDAIDSLSNKIHLIQTATKTSAVFFSSMGAALKIDPQRVRVAEFWKVKGCPFGSLIRKRIRKIEPPAKKFMCVYSEEILDNEGENISCENENSLNKGNNPDDHDWNSQKARINGTMAHVTAIFGFTLAGLVMQEIYCNQKYFRTL